VNARPTTGPVRPPGIATTRPCALSHARPNMIVFFFVFTFRWVSRIFRFYLAPIFFFRTRSQAGGKEVRLLDSSEQGSTNDRQVGATPPETIHGSNPRKKSKPNLLRMEGDVEVDVGYTISRASSPRQHSVESGPQDTCWNSPRCETTGNHAKPAANQNG